MHLNFPKNSLKVYIHRGSSAVDPGCEYVKNYQSLYFSNLYLIFMLTYIQKYRSYSIVPELHL